MYPYGGHICINQSENTVSECVWTTVLMQFSLAQFNKKSKSKFVCAIAIVEMFDPCARVGHARGFVVRSAGLSAYQQQNLFLEVDALVDVPQNLKDICKTLAICHFFAKWTHFPTLFF